MPAKQGLWKLEDAKARFSEVVRRARVEGPQQVTVRGKPAVVVVAVDDAAALDQAPDGGLVLFLRSTHLGELALDRSQDRGRELPW